MGEVIDTDGDDHHGQRVVREVPSPAPKTAAKGRRGRRDSFQLGRGFPVYPRAQPCPPFGKCLAMVAPRGLQVGEFLATAIRVTEPDQWTLAMTADESGVSGPHPHPTGTDVGLVWWPDPTPTGSRDGGPGQAVIPAVGADPSSFSTWEQSLAERDEANDRPSGPAAPGPRPRPP